jgi:hypothetical protein
MPLFIKRPIVVEAVQWYPGVEIDGLDIRISSNRSFVAEGIITTSNGHMTVRAGDYIVTGVKGEKYPVEQDAFLLTYELLVLGDAE